LTRKEIINTRLLEKLFKTRESLQSDFYRYRKYCIKEILYKQFKRIYRNDDRIDKDEALYKLDLQDLFGFGYDQFLEFANDEDILALERGANVLNLDTFIAQAKYESIENQIANNEISQDIKDIVLKRYNERCSVCHGNEELDFDHTIPITKGGSNSSGNIQLLCKQCRLDKA
jgi:hypothetical protein